MQFVMTYAGANETVEGKSNVLIGFLHEFWTALGAVEFAWSGVLVIRLSAIQFDSKKICVFLPTGDALGSINSPANP